MKDYEISVKNEKGVPTVNFANNTDEFIEIVFTVDGNEIKTGRKYSGGERGYCYPDHYERNIKEMARGIRIENNSEIKAYIYEGRGRYKETDFDIPPFIIRRLGEKALPENKKALFKRLSDSPVKILSLIR